LRHLPGCRLGSTRRKRGELAREERERKGSIRVVRTVEHLKQVAFVSTPLPGGLRTLLHH
jgi:hypothetical protein